MDEKIGRWGSRESKGQMKNFKEMASRLLHLTTKNSKEIDGKIKAATRTIRFNLALSRQGSSLSRDECRVGDYDGRLFSN